MKPVLAESATNALKRRMKTYPNQSFKRGGISAGTLTSGERDKCNNTALEYVINGREGAKGPSTESIASAGVFSVFVGALSEVPGESSDDFCCISLVDIGVVSVDVGRSLEAASFGG